MQDLPKQRLMTSLKAQDLDAAKCILQEDQSLQSYIDARLYDLIEKNYSQTIPISNTFLYKEICSLLAIGANPNYRPNDSALTLTTLDHVICNKDLTLMSELLKYGANPFSPYTNITEWSLLKKYQAPIDKAYDEYMHDCFNSTNKNIFSMHIGL